MIFYLLFISFITFLLLVNHFFENTKGFFEILAYVVIIFMAGFRHDTGYDFDMYRHIYLDYVYDNAQEFGFIFLINILRFIEADYHAMFFIMSFLTFLFLYLGLKKLTNFSGFALIVFLLIPGLFLNTLSIIRQALAISIMLYAFSALIEKKYWKYFFLIMLGISFHYSAVLIPFVHLFIWKFADKIKLWHYYLTLIVSLIIAKLNVVSFLSIFLVGLKYEAYLDGESVSFFKLVVLNVFVFAQLLFFKRFILQNEYNKYVIFFTVLAIFLINCFSTLLVITRIAYYFRIFEVIMVAEFVYLFKNKYFKLLPIMIVYFYYISMFVYALQNDIEFDGQGVSKMVPYKNVFFQ